MNKGMIKIRHIGIVSALCDKNKSANLREDLGSARYLRLGVVERFKDDEPYEICLACIEIIKQREQTS